MSLRKQVLQELNEVAEHAVSGIVSAIEREAARRRAEACMQHVFHLRMSLRLPKWRRIGRAWHRALARRSEARCWAIRQGGNPIAIALAGDERGGRV